MRCETAPLTRPADDAAPPPLTLRRRHDELASRIIALDDGDVADTLSDAARPSPFIIFSSFDIRTPRQCHYQSPTYYFIRASTLREPAGHNITPPSAQHRLSIGALEHIEAGPNGRCPRPLTSTALGAPPACKDRRSALPRAAIGRPYRPHGIPSRASPKHKTY